MKTKDEALEEYTEALAKIDTEAHEAREQARAALREQLKALREKAHEDLNAIRTIEQKTKRSSKNAG